MTRSSMFRVGICGCALSAILGMPIAEARPTKAAPITVLRAAPTTVSPGRGLRVLDRKSTGIYTLGFLRTNGTYYKTLALFCNGEAREIHTKRVGGRYLDRYSGPPVKVSPHTFGELIQIAGGVDRSVTSGSARSRFLELGCGAAGSNTGGGSMPLEVQPGGRFGMQCPFGYELVPTGKKRPYYTCRAITQNRDGQKWDSVRGRLADLLGAFNPISSAHASTEKAGKLLVFKFTTDNVFSAITFTADTEDGGTLPKGVDGFRIDFLGFTIVWTVPDPSETDG